MARNLRLFYLYRFLGEAFLFLPGLWLFLQQRGLAPAEILLLNSVFCGVVILLEVPTGAFADRFGRRPVMILGSLAMAAACGVFYVSHGFWAFALGEALLGLGMTLSSGADSAFLYDGLLRENRIDEYRRREGTASGLKHAGFAIACVAGGFLARIDLALPYAVTAGLCLTAAVAAFGLREPGHARVDGGAIAPRVTAAARLVLARPRLRWAILYSALLFVLSRLGLYLYQPTLRGLGYDVLALGLAMGALHAVAAWASHRYHAFERRLGESALIALTPILTSVAFLALSQVSAWWCVLLLAVQSAGSGIYSPLTKGLLQREIPDSRVRATVLSVESVARRAAFGLFTPLLGLVLYSGGEITGALLVSGAAGLAGSALLLRLRHRRASASPPAAYAPAAVAPEPTGT